MFVVGPAGNDIGSLFPRKIPIDTLMIPATSRHVDMMKFAQPQLSFAPVVFFGSRRFGIGNSRQYVGLQVSNGIPQSLSVLGPRQVFVKGIGPRNIFPHGPLDEFGGWYVE
jgi:hypothetical protein